MARPLTTTRSTVEGAPLGADDLRLLDAWWRAANYRSLGQIHLMGNPMLREPLRTEHVKPRLLSHWGTTPGLTFCYAHLDRVIAARQRRTMYIIGPGHGGPGLVARTCRRSARGSGPAGAARVPSTRPTTHRCTPPRAE